MKINQSLIRQARQADLVAYLESKGYYSFKRDGLRYRCVEHSSLVVTPPNAYFWNSRQDSGNSIDFLVRQLKMDFKTALAELTGQSMQQQNNSPQVRTEKSYTVTKNYLNRAYAYFSQHRKITSDIITQLVKQGYLRMIKGGPYKFPNAGFSIIDEKGNVIGYELQGTNDKVKFKGLTRDVKYGYGFNFRNCKQSKYAFFFESAVDLISFIQLYEYNLLENEINRYNLPQNLLENSIFVSMAGLKVNTLRTMVEAFKINSEPFLCVDNDIAGDNFKKLLQEQGVTFKEILPAKGKDWNEYLIFLYHEIKKRDFLGGQKPASEIPKKFRQGGA